MYPLQRSRPDKHTSRVAWENSWADDIEAFYSSRQCPSDCRPLIKAIPADIIRLKETQEQILHIDKNAREVVKLQDDLCTSALRGWGGDDFQNKWKSLPQQRREDIIIEGIYRASCAGPLEKYRGLCPEITLRALSANNGQKYLDLVKTFLEESSASIGASQTEAIYIKNPAVDPTFALSEHEARLPGARMFIREHRLYRMYFMTMSIWNIFLAFVSNVKITLYHR
jgi:hypothetical protein